ncbi:hypothetical protein PIB30_030514 [Stylosanthes scabra]|uniref:Uncharacterized protein n=1 Tax=Stylosanthes scabra TaxID=79078 RepID=A0ABU6Y8S4_9FABA|nr:hypothetical protein [Stylosanthes scabra]
MLQAKNVLQRLQGREDVSEEMALLVEGLGIGSETSIEQYVIGPVDEAGYGQSTCASRQRGSQSMPLMDPLVTLFDSIHEKIPETAGRTRSALFPTSGSTFSSTVKIEQWDEENLERGEDYADGESDDELHSPLMSRQAMTPPPSHGSLVQGSGGEAGIGGGWQLAWKWSEKGGDDGKERGLKRVYLHQEGPGSPRGSLDSVHVAGLVSSKQLIDEQTVGPAMVHPSQAASNGPGWKALIEPGVKHALIVGIGIQMLQQFSGINGVLYYTPQILQEAGVEILLANIGISSKSASFLISAVTTLLMLPCIGLGMRLVDISGRRQLLLATVPVLIISLMLLVVGNTVEFSSIIHAIISTVCVVVYFCCFMMAYGPIPNILCSEIFPTKVRSLCIAICALVFWIGDIIVTYTLPVMLSSIGLAGVFGIYAVVCFISWIFVFFKVPETKGMPLEVITEFFLVGATQAASAKNHSQN